MKNVKKTTAFSRKSATQRRHELIAAAIRCLGKGGMAAFTIDQICKEAGVSRGLINHHFRSKDELLVSIYAEMTAHLIQPAPADNSADVLVSIVETSFDEHSFNRSNLRAWLAVWGQVSSNPALSDLHQQRYGAYKNRITAALIDLPETAGTRVDADSVARQLIALIDGLWLEFCLHSSGFSLQAARADCYRFLEAHGIELEIPATAAAET